VLRGRTIGLSTYVWAFGQIALASDAATLSRPNDNALLGANSSCGSSVAAGESVQGAPSPIVVVRSSWRWAVIPAVSARGAIASCVTSCLAELSVVTRLRGDGGTVRASSWAGRRGGEDVLEPSIVLAQRELLPVL